MFVHVCNWGWGWIRKTSLSPQVIHYWPFQGSGSDVVLCCLRWQSCGAVSPYVCSLYFYFGFGCWVTTFWEIAAHSVSHLFLLYFVYLYSSYFPLCVLRAGFAFWLHQFLFIAFSLLIPSDYQTLWTLIRPDDLPGLIWVQIVCHGYHRTGRQRRYKKKKKQGYIGSQYCTSIVGK